MQPTICADCSYLISLALRLAIPALRHSQGDLQLEPFQQVASGAQSSRATTASVKLSRVPSWVPILSPRVLSAIGIRSLQLLRTKILSRQWFFRVQCSILLLIVAGGLLLFSLAFGKKLFHQLTGDPARSSIINSTTATVRFGLIMTGGKLEDGYTHTGSSVIKLAWTPLQSRDLIKQILPTNSLIEDSRFLVRYKWYVLIAFTIFLIEAFLILKLLISGSQRRRSELESQRLALLADTEHKRLNEVVSRMPGIFWELESIQQPVT